MTQHRHTFVETYEDLVGFGMSRDMDERSLMVYLQKFSDDDFLKVLVPRLSDEEITRLFDLMTDLMRRHLRDEEYHRYFLKDENHRHETHAP